MKITKKKKKVMSPNMKNTQKQRRIRRRLYYQI